MSFRPLKLEYESGDKCARCGLPGDHPEHIPSEGGNHGFEDEPVEYVTFRGKRYDSAPIRALFEGSVNYAQIIARDEPDEQIGALLEMALAVGWAFITVTTAWEVDPKNGQYLKTTLYFKWIGD